MSEQLPEGWIESTIGSVTSEENNRVGSRKGARVLSSTKHSGLVPSDEYFKNRIVYSDDISNYKLVHKGNFAYATNHLAEGSIGLQVRFDEACVSPMYTVFSCSSNVYEPYFFRLLKSERILAYYQLHEQASVDRRGAIRYRDFSKIPIVLPPTEEQRRIVEVLDALGESIESLNRIIEKRKSIKIGLSMSLLNRAEGEARRKSPLASFAEVRSGVTLGSPLVGSGKNFPYLRVANVQDGYLDLSDVKCLRVPASSAPSYELRIGDVLMTEGGDFDKLGRGVVWRGEIDECLYQNHIFRVRCEESIMLPDFLALYSSSWHGKNYFRLASKQSTNLASINSTQLKAFPVPRASLEEQRRIVSIIGAHDERTAAERARLEKLRKLKAGLMGDLLTGRVRVNQLQDLPV